MSDPIYTCAAPLWPQSSPCDHGVCGPVGCICDKHWSGKSDLMTVDNCQINLIAIRVLSVLPVLAFGRLFFWFVMALRVQRKIVQKKDKNKRIPTGCAGIWHRLKRTWKLDAMRSLVWATTTSICFVAYNAYKIIYPERQMGYDYLLSTLYFLAGSGTYSTIQSNIYLYMTVNVKAARLPFQQVKKIYSKLRAVVIIYTFVNYSVHAIPFLIASFPEQQALMTKIYLTVKGLLAFGLCQSEKAVTMRLVQEIESVKLSTPNPTRSNLTDKLRNHAEEIGKAGGKQMIIMLCFGLWPLLNTYGSYLFPIVGFLGSKAAASFMEYLPNPERERAKSMRMRSRSKSTRSTGTEASVGTMDTRSSSQTNMTSSGAAPEMSTPLPLNAGGSSVALLSNVNGGSPLGQGSSSSPVSPESAFRELEGAPAQPSLEVEPPEDEQTVEEQTEVTSDSLSIQVNSVASLPNPKPKIVRIHTSDGVEMEIESRPSTEGDQEGIRRIKTEPPHTIDSGHDGF